MIKNTTTTNSSILRINDLKAGDVVYTGNLEMGIYTVYKIAEHSTGGLVKHFVKSGHSNYKGYGLFPIYAHEAFQRYEEAA